MFFGSLLLGQLARLRSLQLRTKYSLRLQLNVHSEHHTGSKSKTALLSGCRNYDLKKSCYIFSLRNIQAEASEPLPGVIAPPPQHWESFLQSPPALGPSAIPPSIGDLLQSPLSPIYEMRTIRRLLRSHNWSTFIHIKGWESLRLLTVRCFYSSHLPPTHRFQIPPNWITKSTPGDLSCPSGIYHIWFKWITF